MKTLAKYGFILGLICFLASGVLAVVNAVTEPKIALQKEKEEKLSLKEVMPQSASFKPRMQEEKFMYYSAFDPEGKLDGFIIKSENKGYSSNIETLAGINLKMEITGIKIISQNETPGLGSRITEPDFQKQFKGKNLESFPQIQAITGATISSSAVINSVKNKITELQTQLQQEIKNAR